MRYVLILLIPLFLFSCQKKAVQSDKTIKTEKVKRGKLEDGSTQDPVRVKETGSPEKYSSIDVSQLNQDIAGSSTELTPKAIMEMFYPNKVETGEGNERIDIQEESLGNGIQRVTLVHENMMDDSLNGEKYVMLLSKQGDRWSVISLEKNWKCQEDRGHTTWGIEPCE